ncbi:DUF2834 domain-containing protein [Alteromonas gilva]|uniref:DUF2834 domain-containing protein n=1 Tax=Alteromonas gilva TaxID=2987522 RepID=A0ABT5L2N3_9ALTE|nr:DUF2834 domain-containing protein [Alteromonas gilva]MDC8831295.1 DUF2834 domain-containing protein [Alteromonas gilva]
MNTLVLNSRYATAYLWLALLGAFVPLIPFIAWLLENGIDPGTFWAQLRGNLISAFAWLDVVISALVVYVFTCQCRQELPMQALLSVILCTTLVGVSCGLPLLLYFLSVDKTGPQGL